MDEFSFRHSNTIISVIKCYLIMRGALATFEVFVTLTKIIIEASAIIIGILCIYMFTCFNKYGLFPRAPWLQILHLLLEFLGIGLKALYPQLVYPQPAAPIPRIPLLSLPPTLPCPEEDILMEDAYGDQLRCGHGSCRRYLGLFDEK